MCWQRVEVFHGQLVNNHLLIIKFIMTLMWILRVPVLNWKQEKPLLLYTKEKSSSKIIAVMCYVNNHEHIWVHSNNMTTNLPCLLDWIWTSLKKATLSRLGVCIQRSLTETGRRTVNVFGTIPRAGSLVEWKGGKANVSWAPVFLFCFMTVCIKKLKNIFPCALTAMPSSQW